MCWVRADADPAEAWLQVLCWAAGLTAQETVGQRLQTSREHGIVGRFLDELTDYDIDAAIQFTEAMGSDATEIAVSTGGEILSVLLYGDSWSGKVEHYDGGVIVGIEADCDRVVQALYAAMDRLPAHISTDLCAAARPGGAPPSCAPGDVDLQLAGNAARLRHEDAVGPGALEGLPAGRRPAPLQGGPAMKAHPQSEFARQFVRFFPPPAATRQRTTPPDPWANLDHLALLVASAAQPVCRRPSP